METNDQRQAAIIIGGEGEGGGWTIMGWRKVRMEREVGKDIAKNGE